MSVVRAEALSGRRTRVLSGADPERKRIRIDCVALIVDDDPGVRDYAGIVLQEAGFLTLLASSISEALTLSRNRSERIDALLADVELDDGDGIELAKRIQQDHSDIRIIVMSGSNHIQRAEEHNFGFLAKPFDVRRLLDVVRQSLPNAFPP